MPLRDHWWCILVAKYGAFLFTEIGAFVITDYTLFAIDILPIEIKDKNINFFRVDQSKENELVHFALNVNTKFDVIIDDGSHVPEHQLLTLKILWNSLKESGVYIIEDIETSYWGRSSIYGYKFNSNKVNTVNVLLNVHIPVI